MTTAQNRWRLASKNWYFGLRARVLTVWSFDPFSLDGDLNSV